MKYNQYIKDDTLVSEIGMGTWQLGKNSGWKNIPERDAIKMIHQSIDYGVNFFDTAPNYGLGTSEERLGKALKSYNREQLVINTKFGHTVSGKTNFNPNHIKESIEGSLKRLKLDYIDSVIIHNPPFKYLDGNNTEHYNILERLKEEGKIKGYGASLDTFDEMKLLMSTTNSLVIEAFFNILHQDTAKAFDLALKKNVAIIAKIPLDSGWLSGNYNADSTFNDIRKRWSKNDIKIRTELVNRVKTIIGNVNLAQAAISFCRNYDAVSTVIPGNSTLNQLKSNIESVNKPMPFKTVKNLEEFYKNEVKQLKLPW